MKISSITDPSYFERHYRQGRTRKKRRTKKIGLLIKTLAREVIQILILFSLISGVSYMCYSTVITSPYFSVAHIHVSGNSRISIDRIVQVFSNLKGSNIFTSDLEIAAEKIKGYSWIKGVNIKRKLPDSLIVEVKERKPYSLLESKGNFLIDREGIVLESASGELDAYLPRIRGLKKGRIGKGEKIDDPALHKGMEVLDLFETLDVLKHAGVREVNITNSEMIRVLTGDGILIDVGSGNFYSRLNHLNAVYPFLKKKFRGTHEIDLSFDGKVILKNMFLNM